jgi:putative peptidoglycan lipid II flippase
VAFRPLLNLLSNASSPKQTLLLKNASIVGVGTLLSRVAGLVRDQVTAFYFGAGPVADAFFVAFRLPNLLRRLLAEGALTPAFVPIFTEKLVKEGPLEAGILFRGVFSFMAIVLAMITVLGIIAAPFLTRLIAPGFAADPELFELTVLLSRVLFPYIFLITLTALAMGVLNSLGRFNIPALGPVFLNISIIFGAVVISPRLETPIIGLALGALLGGITQLAIQLPGVRRAGIALGFTVNFKDPAIWRVFKLMAPTALGAAAYQISIFINTQLASFLEEGSVSYLYYADRLTQFPLGVFSLALATAILPAMAREKAKGDIKAFWSLFQKTLKFQFFITLPATVGLMIMAEPLVSLLFERGHFTSASSLKTAQALWGYAVGLPFLSGTAIVARVFFSQGDTRVPAKVAAVSLALGILFALLLLTPFKHVGLALASSLASLVNFVALVWILRRREKIPVSPFLKDAGISLAAALFMGLALWPLYHSEVYGGFQRLPLVVAGLLVGPFLYFALAFLLRSPNMDPLRETGQKLWAKFRRPRHGARP